MSFWSYVFDNEYRQRSDIEDLRERSRAQQASSASRNRHNTAKVRNLEARVEELEEQIGSVQLMNRALLSLVRRRDDWDEDAFKTLIYDLDMEDGKLDGQ